MEALNPSLPGTHFLKTPLLHSTFNPQLHFLFNKRTPTTTTLSLSISCKLRTSQQDVKNKSQNVSKKIALSDSSPPPLKNEEASKPKVESSSSSKGSVVGFIKRLPRKVLSVFSNLPLAIGEMFFIAALMAIGTAIEQGEAPDFYFQKYPEDNPVWGFFTWRWILTLGFDRMFSSPIFLGSLILMAMSLMACTYTTQIPLVKVARRWNFLQSPEAIRKQEFSDTLPRASIQDLGVVLMGSGYEVFLKGPSLYAFKGLVGRFAPIGVHLAMLLIMAGGTLSAAGSFRGSVTVPQGLNFVVGDVLGPSGFLSTPTDAFNTEVHVNKFYMDFYDSGEVKQFHSDLSLRDLEGKEVMRKTISVNDPLRYGGITIYQTDWSFSALQVLKDDEGPFNLAMAPLKINGDKKLYGTFLPVGDVNSPDVKGISMLARDLQSIVIYDQEGKFAGVRRPSSKLPIEIDGRKIVIVDAIGSTGLELKTDPGVPPVYAGFGALMLTTCISYLNHAQIWALQDGTSVVVGGKTNRSKGDFPDEMNRLLDKVPEIVESSISEQSDGISSG
ncbi:hypothetical protein LWI29_008870 [Acer saccharum]|uniref:ResB-like domain-containing protein n=1 Tax=Acer saccharum TaxID=4024 RepID=A0AA39RV88_ACESA|nr:hypothetical protein LWI29_008870 [Acer saccharum]KAK1558253.1 hypothetical protein Q3G72_000304 [Acer saccharum]